MILAVTCIAFNYTEIRSLLPCRIIVDSGVVNSTKGQSKSEKDFCSPHNFLTIIKAGSKEKYQRRRHIWRNSTCPSSYNKHGVAYRFMLAMPSHELIDPNGHNQGKTASAKEISDMGKIREEAVSENDMVFLPLKDVYDDSNLKVISMLRWAVDRGMNDETSIVVIHDDEFCLRPKVLQRVCEDAAASNSSLYAGPIYWGSAAYEQQKGFDGSFTPYFGGWLYALSSDLVRGIAYDPDTLFTSMHLGFAEDLQVGKWVTNQQRPIHYGTNDSLGWNVEEENEDGTKVVK